MRAALLWACAAAASAPHAPAESSSTASELALLASLHAKGHLTAAEFTAAKAKVLAPAPPHCEPGALNTTTCPTADSKTLRIGDFTFSQTVIRVNANLTRKALRIQTPLMAHTGRGADPSVPTGGGGWYLDEYGITHHGGSLYDAGTPPDYMHQLEAADVSSSLDGRVGPAIRVYGDIVGGDFEYMGSGPDGKAVQQLGVRIKGAYPSLTEVKAGEQCVQCDGIGSAVLRLHPDAENQGQFRGAVELAAFGQGDEGNFIQFGGRSAPNTVVPWAKLTRRGLLLGGGCIGQRDPTTQCRGPKEATEQLTVLGNASMEALILPSRDGARWALRVDEEGRLSTERV
eukprot:COSAG04_NODE_3214_length_3040_cov_1.340020_2_plen_343_part_00